MELVWTSLNVVAWAGWALVLGQLTFLDAGKGAWSKLSSQVIFLEALCCLEVGRMLVGDLRGNVGLGVALHYTRMFVCIFVFEHASDISCRTVLFAWALTEVLAFLLDTCVII